MIRYEEMWRKFTMNEITEEQWRKFCMCCLDELMDNNKEQLERMKNK